MVKRVFAALCVVLGTWEHLYADDSAVYLHDRKWLICICYRRLFSEIILEWP